MIRMTNTKKDRNTNTKTNTKTDTHTQIRRNTKYTIAKRSERKKSNVPTLPTNFWGQKFLYGKIDISASGGPF